MMRKIFVSLLLLVSGYAMAQPANYVPYASRNRYIALMADSTFHIPRFNGAPSLRTGGSTNDGALAADTANGRLYMYYNGSFVLMNKDTSNTFLNSLYKKTGTDSVFEIRGGTHTFAFTVGSGSGGTTYKIGTINGTTPNGNGAAIVSDSIYMQTFTSELPGLVPIGGSGTTYLRGDGTWQSISSGSYPTIPAVDTPNKWIIVQDRYNPIFSKENMGQSSPGVYRESSMYAPSPVSINDTLFRVYAKGDATNSIHYWESRDSMRTWSYIDTAVYPTPSPTWDSVDIAFPLVVYDNTNDTLHLYYTGGKGLGGPDYGIGHIAFKSNAAHPLTRPSSPMLSHSTASTLLGVTVGFIDVSSMVKKDSKYYWFGSYSATDSVYLFAARGNSWNSIDTMWKILGPHIANNYNGVINPTVWKRSGVYYSVFSDSRVDADGVRDTSKSMLSSMYSADLMTWTRLPGYFMTPRGDTSWNGKQVYDMQFLKVNGGNYDSLYRLPKDTLWGSGLKDQTDNYFYGFISGSYFGCCEDQSGIVYVLPQENNKMNFGITKHKYRNDISFYDRNNTLMLNIPDASISTRGALTSTDWRTFRYKADSSNQWSYIHNRTASAQDANFHLSGYGRVKKISLGGSFPGAGDYTLTVDAYENSGNVSTLKNSTYYGISKATAITSEITETYTGTGEGYLQAFTGSNAHNERFYKKNFSGVFYPFTSFFTLYGKQTDAYVIGMKDNHPVGQGVSRTSSGKVLDINMDGGYNTTSGAITSYGVQVANTATRESGSNNLTNYAGRFYSTTGQVNYSLSLGNPAQYEANYGSLFSDRSLVDKKYVDSVNAANLTEGTYTPTLTNTTNVAASTAYTTYYARVGDWVHVWGTVDIDATAATTITEMDMTLPIATTLSNVYALSGTASFEDNTSVQIKANTSNGKAMWRFTPQSATNNTYSFHFSYKYTAP